MKSISYYKNYLVQHKIKRILQRAPGLYIKIQLLRYSGKRYKRKIVVPDSQIVIEGYPRSANSFSVKAFKHANGDDYKIATHLHVFPQVVLGVKYNIPTLVLIRNPFDCISSYAALRAQTYGLNKFEKGNNIAWLLDDYVFFYENLKPYKGKFVMAEFSDVLKDYGAILTAVNKKYNSNFIAFDHTSEHVKEVFSSAKSHLSPSKDRDQIKALYLEQMQELTSSKAYKQALSLFEFWTNSN